LGGGYVISPFIIVDSSTMNNNTTMTVPVFLGEDRLGYQARPVPQPRPGSTDVLLRVHACGICGTDLNILAVPAAHKAKPGIVLGHEGVATVAAVGDAVEKIKTGDRVVIANRLTCGRCDYCRRGLDNQCTNYQTIGTTLDGAFAPYAIAPERALWKLSENVPVDDAALFEPLSCVVGAFAKAPVRPGDRVAVIGAGPMGMLFAQLAGALGATHVSVVDVAPYRLEFAKRLGVDLAIHGAETDATAAIHAATGIGADIVIDAVGNQLGAAITMARRGGSVILFGLRPLDNVAVNQYTITRYDLNVVGAFVGLNPFAATVQLLESGAIKPSQLITHRLPLSELEHGVGLMRSGQAMKVLIDMGHTAGAELR
jgi:threonine dehydrogenase-like Zn-dependent dehydrogenase